MKTEIAQKLRGRKVYFIKDKKMEGTEQEKVIDTRYFNEFITKLVKVLSGILFKIINNHFFFELECFLMRIIFN